MVQTIIIYLNPEHRPHGLNQLWRPRVEFSLGRFFFVTCVVVTGTWLFGLVQGLGQSVVIWLSDILLGDNRYIFIHLNHELTIPLILDQHLYARTIGQSSIDSTRNLCRSWRAEFWTAWDTNRPGPPIRIIFCQCTYLTSAVHTRRTKNLDGPSTTPVTSWHFTMFLLWH